MAPDLVIADASYKTYPGGVIAVRCTDWIAGGATDEADALASTGETVRETQQINNIRTNVNTAYGAADDTLELTGLPFIDGETYHPYFSYRLEGYLDLTDGPHLRDSYNFAWTNAAVLGMHGAGINFSEASPYIINQLRPRPHYLLGDIGNIIVTDPTDPIFVRAFSETGSTIEVLLEQLVFVPITDISTGMDGYAGETADLATPDGADGGDDNGKFTRFFGTIDNRVAADYQVKTEADDAEWLMRITPADFEALYDFDTVEAVSAHLYGLHGVHYIDERTWTQDTFDNRTTSGLAMGISPEGFGYDVDSNVGPGSTLNESYVSGGVNLMRINFADGFVQWTMGEGSPGTLPAHNQGLRMQQVDQWEWYVKWEYKGGSFGVNNGEVRINPMTAASSPTFPQLIFDFNNQEWHLVTVPAANDDDHDISSWFGIDAPVGVRMEFKRFWFRIRVWDASGAEPSTWDEEFFLRLEAADYDYAGNQAKAYTNGDPYAFFRFRVESFSVVGGTYPLDITVHESTMTHDPYGATPTDMTAYLESPEGTTVGEIDVPYGAEHLVYWGKRVWTEYDPDNEEHYLNFSMKAWNQTGAAEHQRAEIGDLRWLVVPGGVVSMNWSSAQPADITRVHA